MVYAWPFATMTGPFICGFGLYGMVAPFGGDCKERDNWSSECNEMKFYSINYDLLESEWHSPVAATPLQSPFWWFEESFLSGIDNNILSAGCIVEILGKKLSISLQCDFPIKLWGSLCFLHNTGKLLVSHINIFQSDRQIYWQRSL